MKFKFSIKLAIISLIGNIIIAIGVSTCRISQMGIDPFTSMTTGISGFFVQFFNNVYCQLFNVSSPDVIPFSLPMKFAVLAIGILFVTLGCSLYITSDLGTGCYDALSIYMADVMSPSYPVCRIMTDVICVLIGFITGGPLGIATIILMFGTGPLISTWNKLVSKPIVEKFA